MNIIEYFKHPIVWFDTTNYEAWQIAMFGLGAILWVVCYIDILVQIRRKQTLAIPYGCVVTNYGWEIGAALFFLPDMGFALVVGYWAWVILDTFIFYNTIKFGHKQCLIPFFKKKLKNFLLVGILISFFVQVTYMLEYDLPMAPLSGDIINLYMSIAFLYLLFIPGYEGNTLITAWCKFLGTGIINIMFYTKYPENYFLVSLAISIAIFDVLYIVLLSRKMRGKITVLDVDQHTSYFST